MPATFRLGLEICHLLIHESSAPLGSPDGVTDSRLFKITPLFKVLQSFWRGLVFFSISLERSQNDPKSVDSFLLPALKQRLPWNV